MPLIWLYPSNFFCTIPGMALAISKTCHEQCSCIVYHDESLRGCKYSSAVLLEVLDVFDASGPTDECIWSYHRHCSYLWVDTQGSMGFTQRCAWSLQEVPEHQPRFGTRMFHRVPRVLAEKLRDTSVS